MRFLLIVLLLFFAFPAFAQESLEHLPVPRWAELAAPEANLRTGPGKRYPIDWILKKKGLPVEIIQEFEHWRRVREPDGADGWVHKSMLSGTRHALLKHEETLYVNPAIDARVVAKLEKGVIADIKKCHKEWCELKADQFDGWAEKKNLWGVYKDEVF
jgi:SH3-like domain-containing protein